MSRRIWFVVFAGLAALVCLWTIYRFVFDPTITGLNPKLYRQYESINPGMTRQEVVRRMGQPSSEDAEFHLSQRNGFEAEYNRAKQSNSKYYLFWHSGIDITYAIGFDDEDKVILKACGGT